MYTEFKNNGRDAVSAKISFCLILQSKPNISSPTLELLLQTSDLLPSLIQLLSQLGILVSQHGVLLPELEDFLGWGETVGWLGGTSKTGIL